MKESERARYFRRYGIITALLFELIAFVLVGFLVGKFLDNKLNTHNFLLAFGVIGGFVAGFFKFYSDTKRFLK